ESAYLTAAQLKTLAPLKTEAGQKHDIPEDTARQFTTVLTDDGDDVFRIRPAEATAARLKAEVTAVTKGQVEVRLSGELAGKRASSERVVEAQAKVEGLLVFSSQGTLQKILVVTDGQYKSPWAKAAHSVGGIIEWNAETKDKQENTGR